MYFNFVLNTLEVRVSHNTRLRTNVNPNRPIMQNKICPFEFYVFLTTAHVRAFVIHTLYKHVNRIHKSGFWQTAKNIA